MGLTFKISTLGCKLNFAESSTIARGLLALGFRQSAAKETADVCIINTCAVTQVAEKKSRQMIQKMANDNATALVVLTGCYANLQSDFLQAMPNVGIVLDKKDVVKTLAERFSNLCVPIEYDECFFSAYSLGDRTRSFLKVQDGCNYHCAYCTVPLARGESRSPSIAAVVAQANTIAQSGVKEIILTGINIGDFGKNSNESFLQLIQALECVQGIERYRISSIEPNLLTDEIIDFTAQSPKFLPHFHIPLQAGNDRVLQLMQRRYTTDFFAKKIQSILQKIPDAFIGIDVIVGFPTESDAEFLDEVAYLKSLQVAYLHVFPYSQRPRTVAADLPQVPQHKITQRAKTLTDLCKIFHQNFYLKHLGSTALVLFEGTEKDGKMTGFTENYIKVEMPCDARYVNCIAKVRLTDIAPSGNVFCEAMKNYRIR
ncbi:tRNA (N(6)-L-threonylcarbamoyladenosine(37)-C(2))-methylthiotransferase MtaB [Bacteroidia bacterium]|nr:tRNA (N(6)-L-threonylcarbamoyladenosine(37)-C(2))-methylthiotransferase MtaB [Bacteroidia bacterium]GHT80136.1 tRNA (N(6)-L-threonylcarbamoyladenosine(37)-C(2))-methylthiotransferase MtaB [Bacteroidia bacterium]